MDTSKNNEIIQMALTKEELVNQLAHLGLNAKMHLEVHAAISKMGYIVGGAATLLEALKTTLENGTIMMASQCVYNSEPLFWENPPIELRLCDKVRNAMPGYDIYNSDISFMGSLAEALRNDKETYHSYHPNCAFNAWGKEAKELMANQPLNFPLGKGSPLDKMYNLENSYILLIGVGYNKSTAFHLAEHLSNVRSIYLQGGAVKKAGEDLWKKYLDIDYNCEDFEEIGKILEKEKVVKMGKLGNATCRLIKYREAIDLATTYLISKYGG